MEANNFTEALADITQALEKVKLQQKYQKVSPEVKETLARLYDELSKRVDVESYHTDPDASYRQHHAETTDL